MRSWTLAVVFSVALTQLSVSFTPVFSQPFPTLIRKGEGSIPIILSAPHGGSTTVPSARVRTCGTSVTDAWTLPIAEQLFLRLVSLAGKSFHVFALFDRKYVDANAEAGCGYTDGAGRAYYEEYHRLLERYVRDVRTRFPKGGLLVDIHGHSTEGREDVIFRGTRDGASVQNLRSRYGDRSVTGKSSLLGRLAGAGYTVFPPVGSPFGSPDEFLNGGEIVERHGTINPNGIDAIQIEIGRALRDTEKERVRLVEALAQALAGVYRDFYR